MDSRGNREKNGLVAGMVYSVVEGGGGMREEKARGILEARVASGGKLVQVQRGDLRTIKQTQARLHDAGVPTLLATGPPGG